MRSIVTTFIASCTFSMSLAAQSATYTPSTDLPNGRQILAIYIGANSCGPCRTPEVKNAVELAKVHVLTQARNQRASFAAIGVANDWDVKEAATFIAQSGAFDQVVLGGNFTNLAIEQFVWRDPNGKATMPQILIVERTVNSQSTTIEFSQPRILRRVIGGDSIPAWVKQGAPIAVASKP